MANAEYDTDLFEAIKSHDPYLLEQCLKEGAIANQTDSKGRTPLSLAAENGYLAMVLSLLQCGADANHPSPLFHAVRNGHSDVVRMLLKHGAGVNVRKRHVDGGWTTLHLASQGGHAGVVSLLLDHDANVHAKLKDRHGTPLHVASKCGHSRVVSLLLDHDADVVHAKLTGCHGTPLHLASQGGHAGVVSLLLNHDADVHAKLTGTCATALHLASEQGHVEVVSILLDHGAWVNVKRESNGATRPLSIATCMQHWDIVELLLKKHASINSAFPLLLHQPESSVVEWLNQDESRSILSLLGLNAQGESPEAQTNRKLLKNWDMVVAFLWYAYYHSGDHNRLEPPCIGDTSSLPDNEFKEAYNKWIIHAAASLLFVNGMTDLLRHLWRGFSCPNDAAALEASEHTGGMTPLVAALDRYGPEWKHEHSREQALEGLLFLVPKAAPDSLLYVGHPTTNRIPLALAIEKGVPFFIIQEMVNQAMGPAWASSKIQLDMSVTGLPIYLLVAEGTGHSNYDVSDIYEFTRDCIPHLVSCNTPFRQQEPVLLVEGDLTTERQRVYSDEEEGSIGRIMLSTVELHVFCPYGVLVAVVAVIVVLLL